MCRSHLRSIKTTVKPELVFLQICLGLFVFSLFFWGSNLVVPDGFSRFVENGKTSLDISNAILIALYQLPEGLWIPIQVLAFIGTTVMIGLITQEILGRYLVSATVVAVVTPNLFLWTASETGESILLLFCSLGMFSLLKYVKRGGSKFGILASLFFGLALLTRGTLLVWPFVGYVSLLIVYVFLRPVKPRVALVSAGIPFAVGAMVIAGVLTLNVIQTGKPHWSGEGGEHLAFWIYPCLAKKIGCGTRDLDSLARVKRDVTKKMASSESADEQQALSRQEVLKQIAYERIFELEVDRIAVSATLSFVRQIIYTPVRNWLGRLGVPQGSIINFVLEKNAGVGYWFQAVIAITFVEFVNVFLRLIQFIGLVALFRDPSSRAISVIIVGYAVAALATGIAIGNPRYRVATEIVSIPLLFVGAPIVFSYIRNRWFRMRSGLG